MFQDYDFLVFSMDVMKTEYFDDIVLGWFFKTITEYFEDYATKCNPAVLANEISKAIRNKRIREDDAADYLKVFKRLKEPIDAEDYIKDEVVQFARHQAVKKVYFETAPLTKSDDPEVWDSIISKVTAACNVGSELTEIGTRYFVDYEQRLQDRLNKEDRIISPTGITELDYVIGGGLQSGQLGILQAASGAGKSLALSHLGKRHIVGGGKVVQYTLELGEAQISDRYDSSWARVQFQELDENHAVIRTKLQELGTRYGHSMIIKHFPTRSITVNGIRSHLRRVINNEFRPSMLIVDYLDLIKPSTSYSDAYADLGAITADLRGLAGEFKIPVWTATQVNRSGNNAEILDIEHMSDSIQKAFIADILIGICMTREERNDNRARLFLAKNRNGPMKIEIPISTAYDRMCFYAPCAPRPAAPIVGDIVEPVRRRPSTTVTEPDSVADTEEEAPRRRRRPIRTMQTVDFPLGDPSINHSGGSDDED